MLNREKKDDSDWLTGEFHYYLRQEITGQQKEDTKNWTRKIYTEIPDEILACVDTCELKFCSWGVLLKLLQQHSWLSWS